MEKPVKGDVVVLPFPFSDLSSCKKRPALVTASIKGDDIILCQITSEARDDEHTIGLEDSDFAQGGLKLKSAIRPNKIFTADSSLVLYKAGSVKIPKVKAVEKELISIFTK